jgi:flavin reductase (DIM6/NTAB) family NADH-FMN oxidoreductase RutF
MNNHFRSFHVKKLRPNVFSLLDDEWMLITAGKIDSLNTMTASWGGFGILWNRPVTFIFIRPQRYTLGFVEKHENFTLSFFDQKYKDILSFCGSKSGREVDKIKETGLVPVESENGSIYFQQARLVIECRKLYTDQVKPGKFIVKEIEKKIYKEKDYHHLFIAEIISCLECK